MQKSTTVRPEPAASCTSKKEAEWAARVRERTFMLVSLVVVVVVVMRRSW
ncbi:hypothetical protein PCC79_02000 [Propioniciclava soli]|uniref:Uncharacterized protein n=1 Tax=Propioniciclava soli TaxID=2775081 RepID=A0ABZ3C8Q4_9ACTN